MYSIEQTAETAGNASPSIFYSLGFSRASQHVVDVEISFNSEGAETSLVMPAWVPGSYKIRDFVTHQGNLTVERKEGGPLETTWATSNRLKVSAHEPGTLVVRYTCYAAERSVRHSHVDRWHAFLNPGNILMYVDGRKNESISLAIDHPWSRVTTSLHADESTGRYIALNYDILVDSPIEIGDHELLTFSVAGVPHEIAVTGVGNFDLQWLRSVCTQVIESGIKFWGTIPYDRYIFFLQFLPGVYGGLEHANSQVSAFDSTVFRDATKVRRFLSLLTHEFFHTWNVKRIRPVELGPFDYERENYTSMLWLAEGATSYYDDLISYRTGFYSEKEYLKTLSDNHIQALLDVPGRLATSIKESSYLAWVKLYNPDADSGNRFPSYYLKGGVLFLLLDLHIIGATRGERSLEDGMRALYARYMENPAEGIDQDEFMRIVSTATTVEISGIFSSWLEGVEDVDFVALFSYVGLLWKERPSKKDEIGPEVNLPVLRTTWNGIASREEKGRVYVARVLDDSPGADAGIGAGDELIAIDGVRVEGSATLKAALEVMQPGVAVEVLAASEGRIYSTRLIPMDRPRMLLQPDPEATEEQVHQRRVWLDGRAG